jgi:hypothetical protein
MVSQYTSNPVYLDERLDDHDQSLLLSNMRDMVLADIGAILGTDPEDNETFVTAMYLAEALTNSMAAAINESDNVYDFNTTSTDTKVH